MLLFLDTANLDEIKEIAAWGVLDGITTNPTLVGKEKQDFKKLVQEIVARQCPGRSAPRLWPLIVKAWCARGCDIAKWAANVIVKCPLTPAGLGATSQLSKDGIKVNVTLCFSTNQALLAARAGAYFVSPFVGRLDDINQDGIGLIEEIAAMFAVQSIDTKVLAASIRNPVHITKAALAGADIATMPYKVFKQLVSHPLTDKGVESFLADWAKAKDSVGAMASSK